MNFIPFDIKCYNKLFLKFQYLFEAELINEICGSGTLRRFSENEIIIDIGDSIDYMPLVISGSIKILTEDKEGSELLLYYLEMGDTCAVTLNSCSNSSKSTIRAMAESETELLFVPVNKMDEWMVKYKSWRKYVMESFQFRFKELLAAMDNIVFNSLEDRLKNYLRDKALIAKSNILPITHLDIANDLHSSRVVISRLMKKLEKEGLISQTRNKIQFTDPQFLGTE